LIRDNLGSYVVAFYLMGGGLFFGGALLLFEPFVTKLEKKRHNQEEQVEDMTTELWGRSKFSLQPKSVHLLAFKI